MSKVHSHTRWLLLAASVFSIFSIIILLDVNFNDNFSFSRSYELQEISHQLKVLPERVQMINTQALIPQSNKISAITSSSLTVDKTFILFIAFINLASFLFIMGAYFNNSQQKKSQPSSLNITKDDAHAEIKEADDFTAIAIDQVTSTMREAAQGLGASLSLKEPKPAHTLSIENKDYDNVVSFLTESKIIDEELSIILQNIKTLSDSILRIAETGQNNAVKSESHRIEWNILMQQVRSSKQKQQLLLDRIQKINQQNLKNKKTIEKALTLEGDIFNYANNIKVELNSFSSYAENGKQALEKMDKGIHDSKESVEQASDLVDLLYKRAEEIVNTIDVIDDIAEQTNLLALNASIEAARAGKQGQGFAVVAEEVRKLAARSSTATKSITDLLITIQTEAEQASSQLSESNKTVRETKDTIGKFYTAFTSTTAETDKARSSLAKLFSSFESMIGQVSNAKSENDEISDKIRKIADFFNDSLSVNNEVYSQANKLTLSSDQLSRSISRDSVDLSYCAHQLNSLLRTTQRTQSHAQNATNISIELKSKIKDSFIMPRQKTLNQDKENQSKKYLRYLDDCAETLSEIIAPQEILSTEEVAEHKETKDPNITVKQSDDFLFHSKNAG